VPVTFEITASDAGADVQKIKYTTDGSDPTSSGTATTVSAAVADVSLSTSKTVKWAAYDNVGNAQSVRVRTSRSTSSTR